MRLFPLFTKKKPSEFCGWKYEMIENDGHLYVILKKDTEKPDPSFIEVIRHELLLFLKIGMEWRFEGTYLISPKNSPSHESILIIQYSSRSAIFIEKHISSDFLKDLN